VPQPLEGPYYTDVAGWSSALATAIPVFAGFFLVVVADRSGSDEEVDMIASGLALVAAGSTFGPSIGHLYANEWGHGLATMGLRLLAFGGSVALITGGIELANNDDEAAGGGVVMMLGALSGAAGLGLMIYDLVDAPEAARRANREARQHGPALSIGPGSLALGWSF
jgi:hypothetical protein